MIYAILLAILIYYYIHMNETDRKKIIEKVSQFDYYILLHTLRHNLDPDWVKAIICMESQGNPEAENPHDPSYGLMQLTPIAVQDIGEDPEEDLWKKDPDVNIEYGCRYLSLLFTRYGAQSYEEAVPSKPTYKEWKLFLPT